MNKILLFLLLWGSMAHAQNYKNIRVNLTGTLANGMILRYNSTNDTWDPQSTIPPNSTSYIWNQNSSAQATSNFWISGFGRANIFRVVSNSGTQGGSGGLNWAAANDSLYWTTRLTGVPSGLQGGYDLQFSAYGGNVVQSNPLTLSRNGNVAIGGPELQMTNTTSAMINMPAAGLGAPTVTNRSIGTKILLYPGISGTSIDYALGVESGALWFSTAASGSNFKWYAAASNLMTLEGGGNLYVNNGGIGVNLGAGTLTNKLHIVGSPRFQVGNMTSGRVLIDSTGSGVGTWVEHGRPEPQTISTSQTLNSAYRRFLCTNTSDITLTLANAPSGKTYVFKKAIDNAAMITLIPQSGTIDGLSSYNIATSWSTLIIFTDGTNWFVE